MLFGKTFVIDPPSSTTMKVKHIDNQEHVQSNSDSKGTTSTNNINETYIVSDNQESSNTSSNVSTHTVQAETGLPDTGTHNIISDISYTSTTIGVTLIAVYFIKKLEEIVHVSRQKGWLLDECYKNKTLVSSSIAR